MTSNMNPTWGLIKSNAAIPTPTPSITGLVIFLTILVYCLAEEEFDRAILATLKAMKAYIDMLRTLPDKITPFFSGTAYKKPKPGNMKGVENVKALLSKNNPGTLSPSPDNAVTQKTMILAARGLQEHTNTIVEFFYQKTQHGNGILSVSIWTPSQGFIMRGVMDDFNYGTAGFLHDNGEECNCWKTGVAKDHCESPGNIGGTAEGEEEETY